MAYFVQAYTEHGEGRSGTKLYSLGGKQWGIRTRILNSTLRASESRIYLFGTLSIMVVSRDLERFKAVQSKSEKLRAT